MRITSQGELVRARRDRDRVKRMHTKGHTGYSAHIARAEANLLDVQTRLTEKCIKRWQNKALVGDGMGGGCDGWGSQLVWVRV